MNKRNWDTPAYFVCDDNDLEDHSAMYITKGDDWYMTIAPINKHTLGKVPIGFPQIRFRLSGSSQPDGLSRLVSMMHALGTKDFSYLKDMADHFQKYADELLYNDLRAKEFKKCKDKIKEGQGTVHSTHCCVQHGCKYGEDEYCPVLLGLENGPGCPASYQCSEDDL